MKVHKNKTVTSKIKDYKRDKKLLTPPFGQINIDQVMWHKEMLPDFLWIDSLVVFYGDIVASEYYNRLLDVLDEFHKIDPILTGTISDFGLIKIEDRPEILKANKYLIEDTILNPFGNIIRLYPKCPMFWLLGNTTSNKLNIPDTIEDAKSAVKRLFPAKDNHSGLVRALPLNRFFKHNKLHITSNMKDTIKSIEEYPRGDRYRAESFARSILNMFYMQEHEKNPDLSKWSEYFWTYNFKISKCEV